MIRPVHKNDTSQVCDIYNYYVENSIVTFEEEPVSPSAMLRRIETMTRSFPWLVYTDSNGIIGFANASRWKSRSAYRYSVESTIYLAPDVYGRGIGTDLYAALMDQLRGTEFHSVLGGSALPNPASIALHEKLGFENVGQLKEVGFKFGKWIDVGYWELVLGSGAG